jgi:hypothetical protein
LLCAIVDALTNNGTTYKLQDFTKFYKPRVVMENLMRLKFCDWKELRQDVANFLLEITINSLNYLLNSHNFPAGAWKTKNLSNKKSFMQDTATGRRWVHQPFHDCSHDCMEPEDK